MPDRPPTPDGDPMTRLREWVDARRIDLAHGLQLDDRERVFYADLAWMVDRLTTILRHTDDHPTAEPTVESVVAAKTDVALVTRFVLVAKTIDADGTPGWTWDKSDGMEIADIAGMVWWLNQLCADAATRYFAEEGPHQ